MASFITKNHKLKLSGIYEYECMVVISKITNFSEFSKKKKIYLTNVLKITSLMLSFVVFFEKF